jgi:N-acetylglucosaminyldiphosphoundecaprenol N-acetyl-beta-D-mannosaminyltransferase
MTRLPAVLFGVPIDSYDMLETLHRLAELVELGRSQSRTHQVATVNSDFLTNALDDPELMRILQRSDLNIADGMPLVWASRMLGTPVPERVSGADLVPLLADASERYGWKIHLFGGAAGVAARARSVLVDDHPASSITCDAGPQSVGVVRPLDPAIVESIRAVNPDVLCVALGNPKQEHFIDAYREALGCPVMIGVGGSLDLLVGDKKRAPKVAQRIGAEWLFRAAQEPVRLGRRYSHDLRVLGPRASSYWRTVRGYRTADSLAVAAGPSGILICVGDQTSTVPAISAERIESVEIDFRGVGALTPTAHALALSVLREARLHAVPVTVEGLGPRLRRCLVDYGTESMFASHGHE